MSDTTTIRTARPADVPTILQLIGALADYERLAHEVAATETDLRRHLFSERPAAEVLLAESDGQSAGFALYFQTYSTFTGQPGLYLEDLFVRPEHRGNGIGKALLRQLASIAVERGYARMEWAVLDWNQPAIDFYDSLGARPLDDWITYRLTGDPLQRLAGEE